MMSSLKEYEACFLRYYAANPEIQYIKVKNNTGKVPTLVTLYNHNKRGIKIPTYCGVTVRNMFAWLTPNKLYAIAELINRRSDTDNG